MTYLAADGALPARPALDDDLALEVERHRWRLEGARIAAEDAG
jgi:hypothetical protein